MNFIKQYIIESNPPKQLGKPLLRLINLYSFHGFSDFSALLRDDFLKQTMRMAVISIKNGYREASKIMVAQGMILLQNIVQVKLCP